MHLDVVPRKTDLARTMLQRSNAIPRSQQQFLNLIDGHKSLRELLEPATQLGINYAVLAALANTGLIQWSRAEVKLEPLDNPSSPPGWLDRRCQSPWLKAS